MQTIQPPGLVGPSRLKSWATVVAFLALPLAAHAAPVTFNLAAAIFSGLDGAPQAGQLTGSIDYDSETGVFSAARLQVVLNVTGDLFELTIIESPVIDVSNDTKPTPPKQPIVVISGEVKGESKDDKHEDLMQIQFSLPPGPRTPIVDFSGSFVDNFPDRDPPQVTYSVRGSATLAVPEPATYTLLAMGLAAAALTLRRGQRS